MNYPVTGVLNLYEIESGRYYGRRAVLNAVLRRLGMARLPFSVFRRKGRRFYYVQFKGAHGGYLPAVSTKQTSEAAAIETAFTWMREGRPAKNNGKVSVSLRELLREIKTPADAEFICDELKRRGLLKSYVLSESRQAADFGAFLQNFWDYDASPYVKERLRKNHGIHRNYTAGQKLIAEKYWSPFFSGRLIGEITRQDIERFIDSLAERELSAGWKNRILKTGTIPLRWAFSKEIIEKDITAGVMLFSGKSAERRILSPEQYRRFSVLNGWMSVPGLRICFPRLRVFERGKYRACRFGIWGKIVCISGIRGITGMG